MELGVALFDSPANGTGGWAAKDGGLTTFRFNSPTELLNESVIYITNANYGEHNLHSKDLPHLRNASFFKTPITQVMEEYGINISNDDRQESASLACAVTNISGQYLFKLLEDSPIQDSAKTSIFTKYFQKSGFDKEHEDAVEQACLSAWQESSSINHKWESGLLSYSANVNRTRHAAFVLTHKTPKGAYVIDKHKMAVNKALEIDSPSFFRVKVDWKRTPNSGICAFGVGWNPTGKKILREWMTQAELAILSEFVQIEIIESLHFKEWEDAIYLPEFMQKEELIFSPAAGIVSESYLSAASSRAYNTKQRRYVYSPKACWLRSIDRAVSLANANRLVKAMPSINLTGYSFGHVKCRVLDTMKDEFAEAAKECGFVTLSSKVFAE